MGVIGKLSSEYGMNAALRLGTMRFGGLALESLAFVEEEEVAEEGVAGLGFVRWTGAGRGVTEVDMLWGGGGGGGGGPEGRKRKKVCEQGKNKRRGRRVSISSFRQWVEIRLVRARGNITSPLHSTLTASHSPRKV